MEPSEQTPLERLLERLPDWISVWVRWLKCHPRKVECLRCRTPVWYVGLYWEEDAFCSPECSNRYFLDGTYATGGEEWICRK